MFPRVSLSLKLLLYFLLIFRSIVLLLSKHTFPKCESFCMVLYNFRVHIRVYIIKSADEHVHVHVFVKSVMYFRLL